MTQRATKEYATKRFIHLKNKINGKLDVLQKYIIANQFRELTELESEEIDDLIEDVKKDSLKISTIAEKVQRGEFID